MIRSASRTAGLLVVAAALCCTPAAGAAGWVSSGPLSPPDRIATDPQVAVTPGGERVIAWLQELADGSRTPENISVRVAAPGGDFGATQTFAGAAVRPLLAAAADGTVGLAWLVPSTRTVHVARLDPGRTSFIEASPLTVPAGETPSNLHVAVSGEDIVVSFDSSLQNASSIWAAHLPAGAGAVQLMPGPATAGALDHQTFTAGQPRNSVDESAIAAGAGQLYVTWQQQNDGAAGVPSTTTVKLATSLPSGQFGPSAPVDTQQGQFTAFTDPQVATGGGHAYVAWLRETATGNVLEFKVLSTDGPAQTIQTDRDFGDIQAGVDGSGALIVAGDGTPSGATNPAVSVAIVAPGASPAAAVRLTPSGIARQLDSLAVAPDGTALILPDRVTDQVNETLQVFGSFRPAGGSFPAPLDVSGLQDGPQDGFESAAGAVATGGRALALWTAADHSGALNARVHLSELDSTPPVLSAISVPATATVEQRVELSAVATDALSGGVTIAWDFGDGSQAAGTTVSRAFATPGAKTVTVTATDAAGNSTTQTRVIAVSAPASGIDRTAPSITRLSVTPSRFRVGRHAGAELAAKRRGQRRSTQAPAGTTLRLTLSERATLSITIRGSRAGRSTLVRASEPPGAASIAFSGRIGGAALAPGAYTVTVIAIDPAGNRSAPKTVRFAIVKH